MPNWCENRLVVRGTENDRLLFQTKAKGSHAHYFLSEEEKQLFARLGEKEKNEETYNMTFHSLVPVPEPILKEGYNMAGYNWQCDNWGTKWDIQGARLTEEDEELLYEFDTAWAPPEPWVKSVNYPTPKGGGLLEII